MSTFDWQNDIIEGVSSEPPRVVVYGQEGIGKSTFASCSPNPIFIQTENGLGRINTKKLPLATSYRQFVDQLGNIVAGGHPFQTLAIDSLDWLEKLIWADVCQRFNVSHIEKADGGYARGYKHALAQWKEILDGLDAARANGMAIVLIAHAKVERFEDPESSPYDRYTLRLHKDADAMIREWSDAVLFATRKMRTVTEDSGFNKQRTIAKAVGADGGERVLRCIGSPACVAKNRYDLPAEIPLAWDEFAKFLN
jgi:hypothetical protein